MLSGGKNLIPIVFRPTLKIAKQAISAHEQTLCQLTVF